MLREIESMGTGTGSISNITELAKYNNWIIRDAEKRPYSAITGRLTKPQAQNEWCNLATALATVKKHPNKYAGIGFELSHSPFTVIDLDHCINDDGTLSPFAKAIVGMLESYTEYSPSLKGLHVWCKGKVQSIRDDGDTGNDHIEIYSNDRYITVTGKAYCYTTAIGNVVNSYPISEKQEMLENIVEALKNARKNRKKHATPKTITSNSYCDNSIDDIVTKIRDSKQGQLFAELYDNGDLTRYGNDDSRADMALLSILAFWCQRDIGRMEAIFNQSVLGKRDKWNKRADYRQRTISNAIAGCNDVYEPRPRTKLIDLSIYID